MKNILVPTDFSACAAHATNAAFELAAHYNATLHLFNRIDIRRNWFDLSEEERSELKEEARLIHNVELLFKEWEEKAEKAGVKLVKSWAPGHLGKLMEQYIEKNNIDFVVMGSHGASGKNEYFIGSNTQKVVRQLHIPILIVKDDVTSFDLKKVVFASSFNESDQPAFKYFLNFIRPFNPEIHLLAVNTSGWFGQPYTLVKAAMEDFKNLCGDMTCKTHFFKDWTVDAGIRHMSEHIGADLIVVSNQQRHPLKRLFIGSNVEALVNHADIPVLSIDF